MTAQVLARTTDWKVSSDMGHALLCFQSRVACTFGCDGRALQRLCLCVRRTDQLLQELGGVHALLDLLIDLQPKQHWEAQKGASGSALPMFISFDR
jgi:hypothetical protein